MHFSLLPYKPFNIFLATSVAFYLDAGLQRGKRGYCKPPILVVRALYPELGMHLPSGKRRSKVVLHPENIEKM